MCHVCDKGNDRRPTKSFIVNKKKKFYYNFSDLVSGLKKIKKKSRLTGKKLEILQQSNFGWELLVTFGIYLSSQGMVANGPFW